MPNSILRPNGTVSITGWTVTGATSAWDALDDAVTQPTAATTTDRVSTLTAGHVLNLDLTASPADVDVVTAVTIWMYSSTAGNDRITAGLFQADNTTQIGTTQFALNMTATYTWYSATISGLALTKDQIDGAILRLTSGNAGGMSEVRCAAVYVDITYAIPVVWPTYPAGSYPDAVTKTPGLVSYHRLGEASGTTAADEGGRYPATNNGATVGATSLLPSSTDTAYSFDGVNDVVQTAVGGAFNFAGTSPFSIEFWSQTPTVSGTSEQHIAGTPYTNIYEVNGVIGFDRFVGGTVQITRDPDQIAINTPYYVVGTYDGTTIRIYVNSVLKNSTASSLSFPTASAGLNLGAYVNTGGSATSYNNNTTDEVAVYNVEISQTTITDHFNKGIASGNLSASGSAVGTSAAAGSTTLLANYPVSGAATGTSAAAGTATKSAPLAGSTTGVSAAAGSTSISRPAQGNAVGSSAAAGTADIKRSTAGSALGTSAATASTTLSKSLAGTSIGTSAANGTTTTGKSVSGSATGTSFATGSVAESTILLVSGSAVGTSTATGAASLSKSATGSATGTSATGGATTASAPLAGIATGISLTAGQTLVHKGAAGAATGTSGSSGATTATATLAGATLGASAAAGQTTETATLVGSAFGTSATTGDASLSTPSGISGSAVGSSAAAGEANVTLAAGGAVAGTSGASASAGITYSITGSAVGNSSTAAEALLSGELIGYAVGSSAAVGLLSIIKVVQVSGSAVGTSAAMGNAVFGVPISPMIFLDGGRPLNPTLSAARSPLDLFGGRINEELESSRPETLAFVGSRPFELKE